MGYKFLEDKKVLGRVFVAMHRLSRHLDMCYYFEELRGSLCKKENVVLVWATEEGVEDVEAKVETQIEKVTTR